MLTPNADLMRQAREALKGKWGLAVVGNLIFLAVTIGAQTLLKFLPLIGWLAGLVIGGPLLLGLVYFFLGLSRGEEVQFSRLFDGFQRFVDALITYLLLVLLIFLWSLLLIVPGIIVGLSYAQTFFLMADRPELKGMDALKESQRLMKGNRWKLFCLFLRFIGWFLVGALTMGIGYLWVMPYLQTTAARFYDDVLGNGGADGAGGTRVKAAAPPKPPEQPARKPAAPAAPQPAQPPKTAGAVPTPAPEPPKAPINPRARLCLSCHRPIADPEAKACPECGFAIMEVSGFTPKPAAPPPPDVPPASPPPPVQPGKPVVIPKEPPPAAAPPSAPMDLEATVRVGRPRLTSISVNGTPESFDLRLPVNRIGRKSENDLAFPEEKTISGRHCEIYQEGKDWFIKDQGSTNGVLVNGKKVESTALKEGDQIKLGNKIFTFTRMA